MPIVFLLLVSLAAGSRASAGPLTGTFVQPAADHRQWSFEDWRELFDRFQELRLSWVVVQWFPSEGGIETTELILRLADERKMKVMVGLAHDESYWESIVREPDLLEVYFRRLEVRSVAVLEEIAPIVAGHPSFEGFYVPQEIDDLHWLGPERRSVLFEFLRSLAQKARKARPGARLALSGFSNARSDPETLARFWSALVEASGIETVLFQDGIGVGKLDLRHAPLYYAPLRAAVERASGQLWPVVENFEQVEGPPLDDRPFRAVPASTERLLKQLRTASRHSSGEVIAFSVPEYMTPRAGEDAARLFREYRELFPD